MKKFLVFSILLGVLGSPLFPSISFAAESSKSQSKNPGDEPNFKKRNQGNQTESVSSSEGFYCPECKTRLVNDRYHKNTTAEQGISAVPTGRKSAPKKATK